MRAADIKVGALLAATAGTSKTFDRKPGKAVKVKVTAEPEGGYVNVELLSDPEGYFHLSHFARERPKKGDRAKISTAWLWCPWAEIAVMAKEEKDAAAAREKAAAEREEKRAALQGRVDAIVADKGEGHLWWGYREDPTISIEGLEALLDAAEGKR